MNVWQQRLNQAYDQRVAKHAQRVRQVARPLEYCGEGAQILVDGKTYHDFSSNDYLGLAAHPKVKQAAIQSIEQYGVGAGASPLVTGYHPEHQRLEQALAAFTDCEAALLVGSGFKANTAVLQALLKKGDVIYQDKLNHASLVDGGLASAATLQRYPHANMDALERLLVKDSSESSSLNDNSLRLIVSDSVFSMDGDVAPVHTLLSLAKQYHCLLMLDDAHGFGVLGETGAGIVEQINSKQMGLKQKKPLILMATLGKALGVGGAFIAGSQALIDGLVNSARSYIYSTAMPPAMASAAMAALSLVQSEPQRRQRLIELQQRFEQGAKSLGFELRGGLAIQALIVKENEMALALSNILREEGYWVAAIRPPTVPPNTARLRITLSALHTNEQIDGLLNVLEQAGKKLGLSLC